MSLFKAKTPIHHYSLATSCYRRWHHAVGGVGRGSCTLNPPRTRLRHVSILPALSPAAETKVINMSHLLCPTAYAYLVWVADAMRQCVGGRSPVGADLYATLLYDLFHPFNLRQFTLRFAFRGQFPPPRRCFGFLHPCYIFCGVSSCGYIRPRRWRCRW